MQTIIHGVCAIVDPHLLPEWKSPVEYVRQLLEGGCRLVYLRIPAPFAAPASGWAESADGWPRRSRRGFSAQQRYAMVRDVLSLKTSYDFTCLLADDVECARELRVDGLHCSDPERRLDDLRALVGPDVLLGVTVRSVTQARAGHLAAADYLLCDAADPDDDAALGMLQALVSRCGQPVMAGGMITRHNVAAVWRTGVVAVAVAEVLAQATNPITEVQWYLEQCALSQVSNSAVDVATMGG